MTASVSALILAGGGGTRFWPLSRRHRPKQLLTLDGDRTLLRATFERLAPRITGDSVWVCTTEALHDQVARELPEVPPDQILAEPVGRDTAPAIGWALTRLPATRRDGVVAVLPADHRIADPGAFLATLDQAVQAVAAEDHVLALGVRPDRPETGFGYLELGDVLEPDTGLRHVLGFREKPDRRTAQRFVESGRFLWNAGIFVFRGGRLLSLLEELHPEIGRRLSQIVAAPDRLAEIYAGFPAISIDYAVMEKLDGLVTLPLDCGWSDLGSWSVLAELLQPDGAGNACRGDVIIRNGSSNLIVTEAGTVAAIGVSGLVVVQSRGCVLVVPRERAQEVRELVAELERRGRDDLL